MDTTPPSHSERREALQTMTEMVLNLVPVIGGAFAVALEQRLNAKVDRRRDEWLGELAIGLEELRERFDGFDPDDLADNDTFVDAVMTATRMAARNSQREKLDALRNAVLNAAMPGAPDEDDQHRFFTLIDDLTPTHLRLLTLFSDPPGWFDRAGLERPQFGMSSNRTAVVRSGMPELAAKGDDMIKRFYGDLERWDLVRGGISGMMSGNAAFDVVTNDYATSFLAFITDPRTRLA